MKKMRKRIYLDYAAITPIDKRVLRAMNPYLKEHFYNPSSLYEEGRLARQGIEESRKKMAHMLQSKPSEVFFTSGGTESNNLAIQGIFEFFIKKNRKEKKIHMITSSIEHSSVLEIFHYLETKGVRITYIEPDGEGIISPHQVVGALCEETILVSLMYGNNEIGTINDIAKISKEVRSERKKNKQNHVIIHTDASQGSCYLNMRMDYLGADLITLDSSKLYGPRGVGVLYIKRGTPISPIIFGGGQEEGIRSGTENTASIVGMARAIEICEQEKKKEYSRVKELRDHALNVLKSEIPHIIVNGSESKRLPNNINICSPGLDSEFLIIKLDLLGIACSSVTTCLNLSEDSASYVIEALDRKRKTNCSKSSIRISLGRFTTRNELDKALKVIIKLAHNRNRM